jgi:ABC-type dipeptide/oligopeptide/nickel transport system permease component
MIVYSYLLLWLSGEVGIDFTSEVKYIYAVLILSIYPIFVVMKSFVMKYKEVIVSDCYLFHLSMGFSNKSVLRKFFIKYFGMEYIAFFENIVIYMFGYVYFVEAPFAINGVGYKFIMGVQRYDYPLIIGFCIAAFILFSVINIVVEILRYKIDVRGSI